MEKWLAGFFLLNLAVGFVWRSMMVWIRTGVNPYVLGGGDNLPGLVAKWFRFEMIGLGLYCLLPWVWPHAMAELQGWSPSRFQQFTGYGILFVSLLLMLGSQSSLGNSWRIGIDRQGRTELMVGGIYRVSRNPIFLSMRLQLIGVFLVSPGGASLLLAGIGELCMQIQVRLEEDYLTEMHGQAYEEYRARVRRWL